jgi:hypothetical protein
MPGGRRPGFFWSNMEPLSWKTTGLPGPVELLLSDRKKWCRGEAQNAAGKEVAWRSRNAVCWCLTTAVLKCYPHGPMQEAAFLALACVLGLKCNRPTMKTIEEIAEWNDDPKRTFRQVCKAVKKANV